MKKFLGAICLALFLSVAGYVTYYYTTQDRHIFDFPKVKSNHNYAFKHPHKEITMDTPTGGKANFVIFESQTKEPKGVIAYFHGKGSNIGFKKWEPVVEVYTSMGFDFLMLDYRGGGKSRGKRIEADMLDDCDQVYKYLLDYYPEESITIYGKSLGTSFATYVASKNNPRTLILEAPFFNLFDCACNTVPTMPKYFVNMILNYSLTTDAWLKKVPCPVYIIHGTADKIIPHAASLKLANAIKDTHSIDLTIIEDGDHDHLYIHDIFGIKIKEALGITPDQAVADAS
ncbi:MAG: alpha/beta fold hydrolase [Rhabdochlamydiaceae bacterium]|nr:alpha/beta fold hydrolase [Candidatus Amphrikana amoebophyrae]